MPHPLNRVTKTPGTLRFTDETPQERPELAVFAITLIASCSRIELQSSYIFALSIDAQHERAAKLLNACESAGARMALIRTAIQDRLGDEALELYLAILKTSTAPSNARNAFAHSLWGYCDNLPEALLLVDSRYFAEHGAGAADRFSKSLKGDATEPFRSKPLDHGRVDVYRKIELENLIKQSRQTVESLKRFQGIFPSMGGVSIVELRSSLERNRLIPPKSQAQPDEPTQ